MADLLTDDMDIRDTKLSMDVGGNGDYYLTLKETKKGKIVKIDTRIAMSGGNATIEVKKAIVNLYKALQGEQVSSVLQANDNIPLVSGSEAAVFCKCKEPDREGSTFCYRCQKHVKTDR